VLQDELGGEGPKTGVVVDPSNNDVYIDSARGNEARVERFAADGSSTESFGAGQLTDGGGSGLAVDSSSGTAYVADSASNDVIVFAEGPKPEAPLTEAAEGSEATKETLHGQLNPGGATGGGGLKYQFDYNTGSSCVGGQSLPIPAGEVAEAKHAAVQTTALHLQPSSEYTYCLVAFGTYGETRGNEVTFTTLPPISPEEPTSLEVNPIAATTATLKGVLNPNNKGEAGTYEFHYQQSASECEGADEKTVAGVSTGVSPESIEAPIGGLLPNMPYTVCVRAVNEAGEEILSAPKTFTTLAKAPTIAGESASAIEASAAKLQAEIVPEGAATTAHFEYLTEAQFESAGETFTGATTTSQSASIGADDIAHVTEARITGLQPGTTYHYRVVAQNEVQGKTETEYGLDKTLTTSPPASTTAENCPNAQLRAEQPFGLTLPDCRAYEIVSPLQTNGQDATDSFVATTPRAAVSGEAVTYASFGSFDGAAGNNIEDQYLSRRGPGGWSTQPITPPQDPSSGGVVHPYIATVFTPELTQGIADAAGVGLEQADFASGSYQPIGGAGYPQGASTDLSHVVTGGSEWVDGRVVPVTVGNDGKVMEASIGSQELNNASGNEVWHAVSADGSRVYFTSPGSILNGSHEPNPPGQLYLRENAEQERSPTELNAKGEEVCTNSADACTIEVSASQRLLANPAGAQTAHYRGASADGSKVFFTSTAELTEDAYTGTSIEQEIVVIHREATGMFTLSFNGHNTAPLAYNATGGEVQAALEALSSIGAGNVTVTGGESGINSSFVVTFGGVFAGSEPPLITAEGLGNLQTSVRLRAGANLYEYDLDRPAGERLKDLTGEATDKTGDGAAVQGVVQISEDGSYVYFVAKGVLSTEANAQGARAATSQPNLYVSHEGGSPRFIATLDPGGPLAAGDGEDWDGPAGAGGSRASQEHETIENEDARENESGPAINSAVASPDGTRLAFMSFHKLNGYDNGLAEGPYQRACEREVAIEQEHAAPPYRNCQAANEIYLYDAGSGGAGSLTCASCNPSGARPLGPSSLGQFGDVPIVQYRRRNLLEDGALFFDSDDALVPHASDGRQNVYEFQDGQIHAISDVAGDYESFFIDAGANGENVFFGSADRLLPQDTSSNVVVWDARVDGGFPAPAIAPSCDNGDSCKPPPAPQPEAFGAPASATFAGPGNTTSSVSPPAPTKVVTKKTVKCAKGKHLSHSKCVKDKKKTNKAKRAGNHRRAH
jgi:hypothetical protein